MQNMHAVLVQEADSRSMKEMIAGYTAHNVKQKKEVTGTTKVTGGLSSIPAKFCHRLFLINKTLIRALYQRGHCTDSSHKAKRPMGWR